MAWNNDTALVRAPVVVLMCGSDCRSDIEKLPAARKSIRQSAECELVNGFYYDLGDS